MLDEQGLKLVVIEGLLAKLAVLVADVRQHGGLRVQVVVLPCLGNYAALDVAKQTNRKGDKQLLESALDEYKCGRLWLLT